MLGAFGLKNFTIIFHWFKECFNHFVIIETKQVGTLDFKLKSIIGHFIFCEY